MIMEKKIVFKHTDAANGPLSIVRDVGIIKQLLSGCKYLFSYREKT